MPETQARPSGVSSREAIPRSGETVVPVAIPYVAILYVVILGVRKELAAKAVGVEWASETPVTTRRPGRFVPKAACEAVPAPAIPAGERFVAAPLPTAMDGVALASLRRGRTRTSAAAAQAGRWNLR